MIVAKTTTPLLVPEERHDCNKTLSPLLVP